MHALIVWPSQVLGFGCVPYYYVAMDGPSCTPGVESCKQYVQGGGGTLCLAGGSLRGVSGPLQFLERSLVLDSGTPDSVFESL